ncbi:MAG TPA: hypothetical protein VK906_08275, partial [Egicoccus sp.]
MRRSRSSVVLLALVGLLSSAAPVAAEEPATGSAPAGEEPGADATADDEAPPEDPEDAPAGDEPANEPADDGAAPVDEPTDGATSEAPAGEPADDETAEQDDEAGAATFRTAAEPPAEGFAIRAAVASVGNPTPDVVFAGSGWGHGVGMSQYGAFNMAKRGHDAAGILNHYYPGTEVGTDARATERIRVNIHAQVASAGLEAIGAAVEWRHCQPLEGTSETIDHRVSDCTLDDPPAADPTSLEFYEQPAGTMLRVCAWNGETVDPETGELIPPVSPVSGLMLLSETSDDQADCTAVAAAGATTDRPVLRAYHHGNLVRSRQNASAGGWRYQYGWQD